MHKRTSLLSALFALFLLGLISSCSDSNSGTTTDGSTLVVPKDTIYLSSAASTDTLQLKLSCGCAFTMSITNVTGDSTGLSITPVESFDNTLSDHNLVLNYTPKSVLGSHTSTLNFLAHKHTYSYTNKVVVIAGP